MSALDCKIDQLLFPAVSRPGTYIVKHLVLRLESFSLEKRLQRLLLFTGARESVSSFIVEILLNLPINVAELMFSRTSFQGNCDIKCSTC